MNTQYHALSQIPWTSRAPSRAGRLNCDYAGMDCDGLGKSPFNPEVSGNAAD